MNDVTESFLFDDMCVAPSPCLCKTWTISCSYKQLTYIPNMIPLRGSTTSFQVFLTGNQITKVPADAFYNLSAISTPWIGIRLAHNQIHQIDEQAFSGIEGKVALLELSYNNLTNLPTAIRKLTRISELYIQDNPMTSLDSTVMSVVGSTLRYLSIFINFFPSFPSEVHFLRNLNNLKVTDIPFSSLRADAFSGLEASLGALELSNSKLEIIPSAICSLQNLTQFTLNSSPNLQQDSFLYISERCSQKLTSVTILILKHNKLQYFPDVFELFPNVQLLDLESNNIQSVNSSLIPYNSTLNNIYIGKNDLVEIPAAFNKLSLESLHISNNKISALTDTDLAQLPDLRWIDLHGNPLAHVSPNAFRNNPRLFFISFENTNLDHIPRAVLPLANLRSCLLSGAPIICSCDEMSYLRSWNVSYIRLDLGAQCTTGESIRFYLTSILPHCH